MAGRFKPWAERRRDDAQGGRVGVSFWPVDCSFQVQPCNAGSGTMHFGKSNHALARVQPCKLRSPTMQVVERNHALLRVHGSARTAMVGAI